MKSVSLFFDPCWVVSWIQNQRKSHPCQPGETMIRMTIVHPEQSELDVYQNVLEGEPDLVIDRLVTTADEAMQVLAQTASDIVLVSYTLPDNGALWLVQTLGIANEAPKVLVTEMPRMVDTILFWMEEGAAGYVYAQEGWAALVKKVRAVCADEFLLCPEIAAALIGRIAELKQLAHELDAGALAQPSAIYSELTPREREVLHLIGNDLSNQEIADTLVIELGTVKNHVHNLLRKLDVCNRRQAAQVARQIMGEAALEPSAA
jgi:DNA-binding NarL/FixJ family response regulator